MAKEITQYDEWNSIKKRLSTIDKPNGFYFNEGDIWWVSLGINIGTESYGKGFLESVSERLKRAPGEELPLGTTLTSKKEKTPTRRPL